MSKRTTLRNLLQTIFNCRLAGRPVARFFFQLNLILILASTALAIPVREYHQHVRQGVTALATLAQSDETESATAYAARDTETVMRVRKLLPLTEKVETDGPVYNIDNSWLHQELDKYESDSSRGRYQSLQRIMERLQAIEDRLTEFEKPATAAANSKLEDNRRLQEILKRPEFGHKVQNQSAINRLLDRFLKWLASWLPKPQPMSPGRAGIISRIAQWLVIILALVVLGFVLKTFLPRLFRNREPKKKRKERARIVLGERLEPEQSAFDLLSEADALARRGELRAAIRRAYIALLVELGDRKIISLAQYKTNRDYLRAMRELEPLYRNVKQLTDSFELHWYGLAQANETDWLRFRSAYDQALKV
jgi:hypothetical protein